MEVAEFFGRVFDVMVSRCDSWVPRCVVDGAVGADGGRRYVRRRERSCVFWQRMIKAAVFLLVFCQLQ